MASEATEGAPLKVEKRLELRFEEIWKEEGRSQLCEQRGSGIDGQRPMFCHVVCGCMCNEDKTTGMMTKGLTEGAMIGLAESSEGGMV